MYELLHELPKDWRLRALENDCYLCFNWSNGSWTRRFELITCGFKLVAAKVELVTRGFEPVTRQVKLANCEFELKTRRF